MHDMHDSWFFVGILVFIFLIWIATGGPMHPLSFSSPSLSGPSTLGSESKTYLSLPRAPYGIGGTDVSLPGSSNGNGGSLESDNTSTTILPAIDGVTFGEVSPYRGIVSMNHYISGADSTDPRNESITLRVVGNASVPVDISGWTIESETSGNSVIIPQGTKVPTSGIVNAVQDITFTAGDQAILISGQSPIGASFQENKCIGYFSSFQKFSPALPQDCPSPNSELSSEYGANYIRDAACIDYVNTLSRCQVALTPPVGVSSACQGFLATYLNYNGCVNAHQNDADFEGTTWRVYLGRTNAMWRTKNEVVKLLDADGKTVDAFSY
jgi:hypothetical protein